MNSQFLSRLFGRGIANVTLSAVGMAVLITSAQGANLVVNGNFEALKVPGVSSEFGSRYPAQQVTGWSNTGYSFVYTPGTADTTGARGQYGTVSIWGPGNGSSNGFTATSPAGGNFIAADGGGAYRGALSQTISGLTPGASTSVSFLWAGAQQYGFTGATTEQFQVSLGSSTQLTPVLSNVSHGFTGWKMASLTFKPTSASEVLSFLAIGTPGGVPPFSLLDDVSVSSTPEPATLGLMFCTLAGFGAFAYRRRKQAGAAKA